MLRKTTNKTNRNTPTITKKTFLMLILIGFLFFLPLISAATFDNIISFDPNVGDYGRVTIRDWFGLRNLAELELKKNSDICNINCSAEKEIKLYQKTALIDDDVKFLIKQPDGTWEEGNIKNYYFQIVIGGSTISYEPGTVMPKGTYTLKLVGEKDMFETVDWQITSQGRLIDDWAVWTSGLSNGLTHYWNMNEVSGGVIVDAVGDEDGTFENTTRVKHSATGILDYGVNITTKIPAQGINMSNETTFDDLFNSSEAFSISIWIKSATENCTDAGGDGFLCKGLNTPNGYFGLGYGDSAGCKPRLDFEDIDGNNRYRVATTLDHWEQGTWQHWVFTYNGSINNNDSIRIFINGSVVSTTMENNGFISIMSNDDPLRIGIGAIGTTVSYQWLGELDELGIWNRILNDTEVSELYNSGVGIKYNVTRTTLNAPADNYETTNQTITFNCSAIDVAEIKNITLWINGEENYTQAGDGSSFLELYQTLITIEAENQNWTCKSANLNNVKNWATNRTFSVLDIAIRDETHEATAYETSLQNFTLEIQTKPNIKSISGKLWYDETSYDADITSYANDIYNITKDLELPLADTTTENKSFNWEISLTLADDSTIKKNSSTYGQNVEQTLLILCNATYNATMINFSSKQATNPYPNVNATFKVSWDWYVNGSSGEAVRNRSYEDLSEGNHSWGFCMKPQHETHIISATIEYDGNDLAKNYYYLNDAEINNQTQNISIYLLNDSLATLTVLKVQDGAQNPLEDVYIQIQSYDVGTDTYYTTAMGKTSFNGEDLAYLNWYDTLYKFILTQDGEVIKTTSPYKISETPQIFEVLTEITFPYDKFEDFVYSLYFNSATNNFILTFTKPSGLVDKGCLRVIKRSIQNDTEICNVCETSSSATLYCNIANKGNGTYIATFYATGSLLRIATITELIGDIDEIYDLIGNVDGSIYAFFFGGIVLAMFFVSPVLAVIGTLLGALGAMIIGFQPLNYIEFLGMVLIGGAVIWFLKR